MQLGLRLYRVSDGAVVWQDSFSGANGLAEIERRAGDAATRELQRVGAVSADSKAAASKPAVAKVHADDQAYQLYLRGRYFWNRRTVEGLRKSVEYFRQSIDADPNYAPAYAGLADSYALLASFSVEPGRSANADARSAALSAIQIDPTLAEPHASLGMIYFFTDWNLLAAQQEFEVAIRLNPNYATAHHWYALDLAAMGRFPEALYEIHLAQKLDPLSLIIGTNVGWIEYLARDYPAAVRDLHRVLELDPNFARARTRLGMVEMATGDNAAAVADLTQALALSGDEDPWVAGLLGDAEARAGNRQAAEHALAELTARSGSQYVPPISRALVLIGLGRRAEAVAELAKSADDHSTSMVYARVDPSLDAVRADPAFQVLLSRIKL
jgi:tetratricopeptide (TPR) repeat protein